MSAYLTYKLWKLAILGIGAFIYGFIRGGSKQSEESQSSEAED